MESMGEFDSATPVTRRYCTPMSVKDFDQQGTEETAKGLEELILHMEKHPEIYKEILRRKKQDEQENESLFSFLKTRFFNMMGREVVELDDSECQKKMQELTENMVKAYDYNQEIKDTPVRFSKRLALKRARQRARQQQQKENEQKEVKATENNNGPPKYAPPAPPPLPAMADPPRPPPLPAMVCPPAPPLPPPIPAMKDGVIKNKNMSNTPRTPLKIKNTTKSTPLQEKTNTISSPQLKRKSGEGGKKTIKKTKLETPISSSVADLHEELLKFGHNNLKSTGQNRSPGGTPFLNGSAKKKLSVPSDILSPITAFNVQLLEKFRNTRSPLYNVASPSSGFNSPNDSVFASPY